MTIENVESLMKSKAVCQALPMAAIELAYTDNVALTPRTSCSTEKGRSGYDRAQVYMIASVALGMCIGQLADVPNVGVTAILPLDIFVARD